MEWKKVGNTYVLEVNKVLTTEQFHEIFAQAIQIFLKGNNDA